MYKLLDEMPYEEFLGWMAYFGERPPGWQEDLRAGMQIQAAGAKVKPEDLFPSLATMKKKRNEMLNKSAETGQMQASQIGGLMGRLMGAQSGDKAALDNLFKSK